MKVSARCLTICLQNMLHSVSRILHWTHHRFISTSLRSRRRDSTMKAITKKTKFPSKLGMQTPKYQKEKSFIWRLWHITRSMGDVARRTRGSHLWLSTPVWRTKSVYGARTNFSNRCVDSKRRTQQVLPDRNRLQTSFFRWQWQKSENLTSRFCMRTRNRWHTCNTTEFCYAFAHA